MRSALFDARIPWTLNQTLAFAPWFAYLDRRRLKICSRSSQALELNGLSIERTSSRTFPEKINDHAIGLAMVNFTRGNRTLISIQIRR